MGIDTYNLLASAANLFKTWVPAIALAILMYYFVYLGIKEDEPEYFAYASFAWVFLFVVSGAAHRELWTGGCRHEVAMIWLVSFILPLLGCAFYRLMK